MGERVHSILNIFKIWPRGGLEFICGRRKVRGAEPRDSGQSVPMDVRFLSYHRCVEPRGAVGDVWNYKWVSEWRSTCRVHESVVANVGLSIVCGMVGRTVSNGLQPIKIGMNVGEISQSMGWSEEVNIG